MKEYFFNFVHPYVLIAILFLPPFIIYFKKRKLKHSLPVSSSSLFSNLPKSFKQKLALIRPWLFGLALTLLIVALARPQSGYKFTESISDGVDIMLALDTSGSMKALDFAMQKNETNRLDVVKNVVGEFIQNRQFDRVGIVVFGEEAFTQCPLTTDHSILNKLVSRLSIGMAGDGTAIGDGLALAIKRLKNQKTKSKVVILLTDGRNNAGSLSPEIAAQLASELDIKVYAIGVGSVGPVPYPQETPFGIRKVYAQLDLDEETLKMIAQKSGGRYFRATNTNELESIYKAIDSLEKTEIKLKEHREVTEYFQYFMYAGFFILLFKKVMDELYWFSLP